MAENWGRRDGIRAGSVSGPWRSGPRANEPGHRAGPPRPEHAHGEHAPLADALDEVRARRAADAHDHAHRSAMMVLWIVFGAFVAIGAVILAFVFRPDLAGNDVYSSDAPVAAQPDSDGSPAEAAAQPGADGSPAAAAAPPEAATVAAAPDRTAAPVEAAAAVPDPVAPVVADPALAVVSDLRLRVGPGFPDARREAIVAALEEAGIRAVQVEALPFRIATSRVGYYRAEDLPTAQALVRLISPVLAEGQEIGVRDYSQLLSDPVPGRLDLWVGS